MNFMKIKDTLYKEPNIDKTGNEIVTLNASKFKRLGRDYFGTDSQKPDDLDHFLKQLDKYNLYKLPIELNEFFLDYHSPPFSFVKEYYLINELAKKSHELRNLTFSNKQLEEFFLKWTTSQNDEGRLYYAKSLLSKIRDDQSKAINMLILAFIFTYENSLTEYDAAINLFLRTQRIFERIDSKSRIKDRILYLINIFAGFTELRKYSLDDAYEHFQNAIQFNKWSANAKFYSALTEIQMNNPEEAISSLKDVIKYDEMRINFAITSNNFMLFKYFLHNTFIQNIFNFHEFSGLSEYFQKLIAEKVDFGALSLHEIISKSEGLSEKKANKYLKEANRKDLVFIEKLLKDYKESRHYYVQSSIIIIEKKLNNIIESIIKNIKEHYEARLNQHKKLYDDKLEAENIRIAELENSIKAAHQKLDNDFKARKYQFEREIDQKVSSLEFQLESLENSKNEESLRSFTNGMFYNLFISLFVALTGGFAEYTNSPQESTSNFLFVLSSIFLNGLKWGLLSFIIGLIASAFSSISAVISIYSRKQRLAKRINEAKSLKQKIHDTLMSEVEVTKEKIASNTTILINNHKKNLERLKIEKDKKISELEKEIRESIEQEVAHFQQLID